VKVKYNRVDEATVEQFADKHGLTMIVSERENQELPRFSAHFEDAEIQSDGFLVSTYGDGETEAEAICDYGGKISLQILVFKAYTSHRWEVRVPRITEEA
jgi:hypothetical protein